jgi:hypothetical protein
MVGFWAMATYLTLVHGTFARGAKWCQASSALAQYLITHIPGVRLTEPPFEWSGRNTFAARIEASQALRIRLEQNVIESTQDDGHYVIAHSHGGNVAGYAVAGSTILTGRVGIVCLGTPFLLITRRNLPSNLRERVRTLRTLSWIALVPCAICAYVIIATLFYYFLGNDVFGEDVSGLPWIVLAAIAFPLALFALWTTRTSRISKLKERAETALRDADLSSLPRNELKLVRSVSDEASLLLMAASFFRLVSDKLWSKAVMFLPYRPLKNKVVIWILRSAVCVAIGTVFVNIKYGNNMGIGPIILLLLVWAPFVVIGGLCFGLLVLLCLFLACAYCVSMLAALPAGYDLAGCEPFLRVSVESSPLGDSNVALFGFGVDSNVLSHSSTYDDPRVHKWIADWMEERQKERK